MITQLTPEQEKQLSVYRDKWIKIGLSTDRLSFERAVEIKNGLYENILKYDKNIPVFVMDSPLSAFLATIYLANLLKKDVRQVKEQVRGQVGGQVWQQVWQQVEQQVLQQVRQQVLQQVWQQVDQQVWQQVRQQVEQQAGQQVLQQVRGQVYEQVSQQVLDQVLDQVRQQVEQQAGQQVRQQVYEQVSQQVNDQVLDQVLDQVRKQVMGQVLEQVSGQVGGQVCDQVWEQVSGQVREQVRGQVRGQVYEQVEQQVWQQVYDQVIGQVRDFFFPYLYGAFDAGYISFYDFMFSELKIKNPVTDAFNAFKDTSETGCIYAMKEFCVISQKPIKINMLNGKLHSNGSPAWEYADGVKGWSLNGVAVPQYLAEKPEGELDIKWYLEQKNADVKAEFVRKYGIERMLSFGNKVDDYSKYNDEWWTKSEYELWNMGKLFDIEYQPYLKMRNQTTGVWHMEAVHPDCKDLVEAIKFRFEGKQVKIINIK